MPSEGPTPARWRLSLRHFYVLATLVILLVTGMVPWWDIAFALFSVVYVLFLSKVAFPSVTLSPKPPVFGENNRLLGRYVFVGAIIGLFLPIGYIAEGAFSGHKEGISVAVPHLFLLCCQIFMEGVTFKAQFSLPVRAFVPVFYNSKRLFTIVSWLSDEFTMAKGNESTWRLPVVQVIAVANLAFWSFNLFGFLLPVYLPRVFKLYYAEKEKP